MDLQRYQERPARDHGTHLVQYVNCTLVPLPLETISAGDSTAILVLTTVVL
jgi:hypothetical protein